MTIHPSALPEQRKPLCFLIAFRLPHATPPSGLPVELFLQAKGAGEVSLPYSGVISALEKGYRQGTSQSQTPAAPVP